MSCLGVRTHTSLRERDYPNTPRCGGWRGGARGGTDSETGRCIPATKGTGCLCLQTGGSGSGRRQRACAGASVVTSSLGVGCSFRKGCRSASTGGSPGRSGPRARRARRGWPRGLRALAAARRPGPPTAEHVARRLDGPVAATRRGTAQAALRALLDERGTTWMTGARSKPRWAARRRGITRGKPMIERLAEWSTAVGAVPETRYGSRALVLRRRGLPAPMAAEAGPARHTEPQGAGIGLALRPVAVAANPGRMQSARGQRRAGSWR